MHAAKIVCRELGHGAAESLDADVVMPPSGVSLSANESGTDPNATAAHMYWGKRSSSGAKCRGGESYLRECPQTLESAMQATCEESHVAQLVCGE